MLMFLAFWKISNGPWQRQWTVFAVGRILLLWQPATLQRCHSLPKVGRGPFLVSRSLAETVPLSGRCLWTRSFSSIDSKFHSTLKMSSCSVSSLHMHSAPRLSLSKSIPLPLNLSLSSKSPSCWLATVSPFQNKGWECSSIFLIFNRLQWGWCHKFLDILRAAEIN